MNDAMDEIERRRDARRWARVDASAEQAWESTVEHFAANREMLSELQWHALDASHALPEGPMRDTLHVAGLAFIMIESEIRAREEESRDH